MAGLLRSAARVVYDDRPADAVALDSLADAFGECRRGKAFREATCGAYHFRPTSCHVRLCPDCERARATRLVERFEECADTMESPKLWTLTVPNVPTGELAGGLRVLLDSLTHLRRRAIFAGGPCQGAHRAEAYEDPATGAAHPSSGDPEPCSHPPHRKELAAVGSCRCARCLEVVVRSDGYRVTSTGCPRCCHQPVRGGIYSLEITWSEAHGDWHPHAHLLVDAPWIAWSEVRDAWRAVTCDAIRRAELRECSRSAGENHEGEKALIEKCPHLADAKGLAAHGCRGASIVWVSTVGQPGQERRAAVRETLKYLSKGLLGKDGQLLPGATELGLAELLLAVRRRRLVAGWGTFRNVHDDDDEGLDPAEYIVSGPEVLPELVGLPRKCPTCHAEALWEFPINVARSSCRRSSAGNLVWRPPQRYKPMSWDLPGMAEFLSPTQPVELLTVEQSEDAGANALASLIADALTDYPCSIVEPGALRAVCRELLNGPLAEDYSGQPGGYCMRAPTDPTLAALSHLGASLVEISYTARNVPRALDEFEALLEEFRRVARS